MSSILFDSCLDDMAKGNINFNADTFKAMLVTSSYTPNKATHTKRSDVTSEVAGTGYTAGGSATSCTLSKDTVNHREDMSFAAVTWPTASITARGAVIYKSRGGLASADEIVGYVDFGADITSTGANFVATFASPFRLQN